MFGFTFTNTEQITGTKNKKEQQNKDTLKKLQICLNSQNIEAISNMIENNKLPDELTHTDEFQNVLIKTIENILISNPAFALFLNNEFNVFEISRDKLDPQKIQSILEKCIINLLNTPQTYYNIPQNYKCIKNIIKKFSFDTTVIASSDEIQSALKKFICSALTTGSFQIVFDIISVASISNDLMADEQVQKSISTGIKNSQRHIQMINDEKQKTETEEQIEKIKQYLKNQ